MTDSDSGSYIVDFISKSPIRSTPEEVQAVQPFSRKLVEDYGYPPEEIQVHPQWRVKARPSDTKKEYPVDITVFNGEHRFENEYIIVECKQKSRKDGRSQLENYLKFSNARLGVWYNGDEALYLRKIEVISGEIHFEEVPNIPIYGQRIEDVGLFKRKDLKSTHNLRSIFNNIRNYLAANNAGQTLDTEFVPQIINIIFCKIYDERFTRSEDTVSFRAGLSEDPKDVEARIQKIFKSVKTKYPDVFDQSDNITLATNSILYIVGELQQYCLIDTERDVIADAFETFIGPSLRGGQGQFFTPRNVIRLILTLVDPKPSDYILDPACGSGGFLVEALKHVWATVQDQCSDLGWPDNEIVAEKQEVAIKHFRGIDKENFLSKTTKAYMAILGDGRGGIFCENSLDHAHWSHDAKAMVPFDSFDVIITNPPYGSKLKIVESTILCHFDLGFKWTTKNGVVEISDKLQDSQTPQVLFIEQCLNLLKVGGRLGVVAPESMFCNPSHRYIMEYIRRHAEINAVISMPEDLFQPDTHAKTCVVLMTKCSESEGPIDTDHEIFMAIAKWCGHDSRGLPIKYDDIPLIIDRFLHYKEGNPLEYDRKGFIIKQSEIINNIYLPKYYDPELSREIESLKSDYDLISVGELIEQKLISISTGDEVGKLAYGTGNIPFIRTSDIANWEIKLDPKQGLSEEIYLNLSDKQDVRPYDILMVRDGTYLVGTCALITEDETKIVYQSHLYKIRSLSFEKLNPYLLLALLSSPIVKRQIRSKQFTQDIIDTLGDRVKELILPFPKDKAKQEKIIKNVEAVFAHRMEAKKLMRNVLLGMTPIHDYDEEDNSFLTLI